MQAACALDNVKFGGVAGGEGPLPPGAVAATRTGARTVVVRREDGGEAPLHSRFDPVGEARTQVRDFACGALDTVLVFGMGLGYHAAALAARLGAGNHLVVIERSPAVFRAALEAPEVRQLAARPRTFFFVGCTADDLYDFLAPRMSLFLASGLRIVRHAPSCAAFPSYYGAFARRVEDFVRTGGVLLRTTMYLSRVSFRNRLRNVRRYLLSPGILPYQGRFKGSPGVVVSAGPSLAKNMALLAHVKGRAPMVAVSTALRALLSGGIRPDFAVIIDYGHLSRRYFEDIPGAEHIPLICDLKANAGAVAAYGGPALFCDDLLVNTMLEGIGAPKGLMPGGSTVAHAAYHFARYLGCDPVIFVGQDLAYTDGELHVPGTAVYQQSYGEFNRFYTAAMKEHEYYLAMRPRLRDVPAWGGGTVKTCDIFSTYLEEFEGFFRTHPERVIDATEGGALKRGAAPMPLAEAIDAFMGAPLPAERFRVPELDAGEQAERLARAETRLRALLERSERLASLYDRAVKLVRKVCAENRRGRPADAVVAKVLRIKEELKAYGDLYLLLTHLAQSDLFLRMRRDRELDEASLDGVKKQQRQAERDLEYLLGLKHALAYLRDEIKACGMCGAA